MNKDEIVFVMNIIKKKFPRSRGKGRMGMRAALQLMGI
jgi:hypothetical protein